MPCEVATWPPIQPWQEAGVSPEGHLTVAPRAGLSPYLRVVLRRYLRIEGVPCALCGLLRKPSVLAQRLDRRLWWYNVTQTVAVPASHAVALCAPCAALLGPDDLSQRHSSTLEESCIIPPPILAEIDLLPPTLALIGQPTVVLPELYRWWVVSEQVSEQEEEDPVTMTIGAARGETEPEYTG